MTSLSCYKWCLLPSYGRWLSIAPNCQLPSTVTWRQDGIFLGVSRWVPKTLVWLTQVSTHWSWGLGVDRIRQLTTFRNTGLGGSSFENEGAIARSELSTHAEEVKTTVTAIYSRAQCTELWAHRRGCDQYCFFKKPFVKYLSRSDTSCIFPFPVTLSWVSSSCPSRPALHPSLVCSVPRRLTSLDCINGPPALCVDFQLGLASGDKNVKEKRRTSWVIYPSNPLFQDDWSWLGHVTLQTVTLLQVCPLTLTPSVSGGCTPTVLAQGAALFLWSSYICSSLCMLSIRLSFKAILIWGHNYLPKPGLT